MKYRLCIIVTAAIILTDCTTWVALTKEDNIEVFNRVLRKGRENEKIIYRLNEKEGEGIAWFKTIEFTEGTIEFDARGRDVFQKSFIGIAFHGVDNTTYESVYFRPFNFQAKDSVRHIHAVQYAFEPNFGFQELRTTRKDEFESPIRPSNIQASEWFHVKITVSQTNIKVFLNGNKESCLEVVPLNTNPTGKKIGYWVGNNSNGDFANLKVSK